MNFANKCKLLGTRRNRRVAPATDNRLRAALLPRRRAAVATPETALRAARSEDCKITSDHTGV